MRDRTLDLLAIRLLITLGAGLLIASWWDGGHPGADWRVVVAAFFIGAMLGGWR